MKKIVLIPTYNEKENLGKMIDAIKEKVNIAILIIDDNSPDGTGQIADALAESLDDVFVLHRAKREGIGHAYVAGFKWALNKGYDVIMQMDCDFSHDPKYLPDLLKEVVNFDLVIGSRYSHGVSCYNRPLRRILLSKFANSFVSYFARMPIKDSTSGFKCYRREVLQAINLDTIKSNGYMFQIETAYRAYKLGYQVEELPIIFYERKSGVSKIPKPVIIETFFLVLQMFLGLYKFKGTRKAV